MKSAAHLSLIARVRLMPKADPTKVRSLAILNPLYRIIDKLILTTIEKQPLLNHQYGFLKKKNHIMHFAKLKEEIEIMKQTRNDILVAALYLPNAFEEVSFSAIYNGLKYLNVPEKLYKITTNHIEERYAFTIHKNKKT